MLRDFIWSNFELTGSIKSYLAYKEFEQFIELSHGHEIEGQEPVVSNM